MRRKYRHRLNNFENRLDLFAKSLTELEGFKGLRSTPAPNPLTWSTVPARQYEVDHRFEDVNRVLQALRDDLARDQTTPIYAILDDIIERLERLEQ